MRRVFASWREPALLGLCAAILAAQLFAPPFIGLADNGDFGKVAGRLSLGPQGEPSNFTYFIADWVRSSRYYWKSETLSSELPLAWSAERLAVATKEGDRFDIRWLGAVHGALLLVALYTLIRCLRSLPGWPWWVLCAAVVCIFTDVSYVAYFNSFYTDTAALLGLLLTIGMAVHIAVVGMRNANLALFCLASLLFIGSKPQHAIWGFLPAGFVAMVGRRRGWAAALLLLGGSAITLRLSPPHYSAAPLFTLIFSKLARQDPAPQELLVQLGLRQEDSAFIGMHAFLPEAPIYDSKWLAEFTHRTSFRTVLNWYFHHPWRTLALLNGTLIRDASQMRPDNLSNFRRQDGRAPGARTDRFAFWSSFRGELSRKWPHHMLAWYLLVMAGSARVVRTPRTPVRARLGWIAVGIGALGIGEFGVASLADAAETSRHLFLFHACTDLTIGFAIAWALAEIPAKFCVIMNAQCHQHR